MNLHYYASFRTADGLTVQSTVKAPPVPLG